MRERFYLKQDRQIMDKEEKSKFHKEYLQDIKMAQIAIDRLNNSPNPDIEILCDKVECNICKISRKISVGNGFSYGYTCDKCKKEQKKAYEKERENLIGKKIVNVRWGDSGSLLIDLDNNKTIEIADGEYGDDCSSIGYTS